MRKIFPEDTYYVRGQDAYLLAICYDKTKEDVSKYLMELSEGFEEKIQVVKQEDAEDEIFEYEYNITDINFDNGNNSTINNFI